MQLPSVACRVTQCNCSRPVTPCTVFCENLFSPVVVVCFAPCMQSLILILFEDCAEYLGFSHSSNLARHAANEEQDGNERQRCASAQESAVHKRVLQNTPEPFVKPMRQNLSLGNLRGKLTRRHRRRHNLQCQAEAKRAHQQRKGTEQPAPTRGDWFS